MEGVLGVHFRRSLFVMVSMRGTWSARYAGIICRCEERWNGARGRVSPDPTPSRPVRLLAHSLPINS